MSSLLEDVRVIDITAYLSGPFLTMLLGGMGAEVIKVERPQIGDSCRWTQPFAGPRGVGFKRQSDEDISLVFLKRDRNKKSVTLNLNSTKGREILFKLLAKADILVENFRPGVMRNLGIGYEQVKKVKPDIIYCSISCFGQDGPYRDYPGFDHIAQCSSGIMTVTGLPEGPPLKCGSHIGDTVASLYGAIGILGALICRQRTGRGERIDVSMQDGLFSLVMDEALDLLAEEGIPVRAGNRLPRLSPFSAYETKDKRYLMICVVDDRQWANLLKAMAREELGKDERFTTREARFEHIEEIERLVVSWARSKTLEEAVEILRPLRVPCAPVVDTVDELLKHPQLLHRGMITELEHPMCGPTGVKAFEFPIKFANSAAKLDKPAPRLGQDNKEVYGKLLGLTKETLSMLEAEGII